MGTRTSFCTRTARRRKLVGLSSWIPPSSKPERSARRASINLSCCPVKALGQSSRSEGLCDLLHLPDPAPALFPGRATGRDRLLLELWQRGAPLLEERFLD